MAEYVKCVKELGIVSDKCHGKINDADINLNNGSIIPPTPEKVTKSTTRKSFSNRRSSCFDSSGRYSRYCVM
jgi:hypothetical protein